MKSLLTILFVTCSVVMASAQDADRVKDLEKRIRALEERMATLEGRLARTEGRAAVSQQSPETKKMEKIALRHMQEERQNCKYEDIQNAEEMYSRASTLLRGRGNPKPALDSVVAQYPHLNRAGCARLYRAQLETGPEREVLLKDCIARFGKCFYGDGAQVAPLALFELADYYRRAGNAQKAKELFSKVRKEYPGAVGHDGVLLVDKI